MKIKTYSYSLILIGKMFLSYKTSNKFYLNFKKVYYIYFKILLNITFNN